MPISSDMKSLFLEQLLSLVEVNGWSQQILEEICRNLNLSPKHYHIWFPGGADDILTLLEDRYDQEMLNILTNSSNVDGVTKKISAALKIRICATSRSKMLSIKNSCYYILPQNSGLGLKLSWKTVDLIWRYAGDESVDFNYYSKRSLLQGVYLASQTYYNLDTSEDHIMTHDFIDKSLNQVVSSAKFFKKIPQYLSKIPILRMFI
jgi:ubiquinone biosynthesis protein COQ9